MAARAGMANLITEMRVLCNAGTADYTVASVTYFSDDQLQATLDGVRTELRDVALVDRPQRGTAGYSYLDYEIPRTAGAWFEEAATGSGWAVKDGTGATVGTALYSVNYRARMITFASDTGGSAYTLDARAYDLNRAAANLWRRRAALEGLQVDWSSDNHSVKASQRRDFCLDMAAQFDSQAGPTVGQFVRVDEVWT